MTSNKNSNSITQQITLGYRKNSLKIILFAFIIAWALIIYIEYMFFSGAITKIPEGYLVAQVYDHKMDVVYKIHEYNSSDSDEYNIYLLGGSSTREAIISENYGEKILSNTYGFEANFELLAFENLSLMDTLLLVDNLPDDSGLVVLGLGPTKLRLYDQFLELPLYSDIYMDYLINDEYIKSNYGLDRFLYGFFGLNTIKQIVAGLPTNISYYTNLRETDTHYRFIVTENPDLQDQIDNRLVKQYDITDDQVDFFIRITEEIIALCEEKGLEVMLWDTPYNYQALDESIYEENTEYSLFLDAASQIEEDTGVYRSDFIWDLDLASIDGYYDITHIDNPEARYIIQDELMSEIYEFLTENN